MTLSRPVQAAAYAIEFVLVILGLVTLFAESRAISDVTLLVWDALAALFVIGGALIVQRDGLGDESDPEAAHSRKAVVANEVLLAMFGPIASLVGLASAVQMLVFADDGGTDATHLKVIGMAAVLLAWLLLHISNGRRYERFYLAEGRTGMDFPGNQSPRLADFLYFALTIGTTFATSDVDVTTRRMRWRVMIHSIVGFFYNAVVLAIAFNVLTSF